MHATMTFKGTGNELFGRLVVGVLLTFVTAGIYMPWFVSSLTKYIFNSTTVHDTSKQDLKLDYTGTGGQLFVKSLVGVLLCSLTFGIYGPWFFVSLSQFVLDNSTATAPDGTVYKARLSMTGGDLFGKMIVPCLLTGITFGIYLPWMVCRFWQELARSTEIQANGKTVAKLDFTGQGGPLFKLYFVGVLLMIVTLGIYAAWFEVNVRKFMMANTKVTMGNQTYTGNFLGTGNTNFGIIVIGSILTSLTFGIYGAWELANILKFRLDNTEFEPEAVKVPGVALPA